MSKIGKSRCAIAVGAVALALGAAQVNAAELTVVNFGGANGDAQKAAFNQPFEQQTGNKVTAVEYNGEQAKVKAMSRPETILMCEASLSFIDSGGSTMSRNWPSMRKRMRQCFSNGSKCR